MIHAKGALPFARRQGLETWYRRIAADAGFQVGAGISTLPPLAPRANHGRWLVDCPGCPGAELVDASEPVFICLSCGNKFAGFLPVAVQFPAQMTAIERILDKRRTDQQNWTTETIAELVAENASVGVEA